MSAGWFDGAIEQVCDLHGMWNEVVSGRDRTIAELRKRIEDVEAKASVYCTTMVARGDRIVEHELEIRELKRADDVTMTAFGKLEAICAEQAQEIAQLKERLSVAEVDATRWSSLRAALWVCELNQYSGPKHREYLWSTRFSSPLHEENASIDAAFDASPLARRTGSSGAA